MERSETDRIGVSICQEKFTRLGFIFREQMVLDYGIDAIIESKNNGYASGQMIGLQIKSGKSYFDEESSDAYVYRGQMKHYYYWLNYCLPVLIVIVDIEKRQCYWQKIEKILIKTTENGWKIDIPKKKTLDENVDEIKGIIDSQSESEKRFNSLLFSLDWMKAARDKKNLLLEVDEWINKSSGRGDFRLYTLSNEIKELIFEQTYMGFGSRDYSLVIRDMFPWAYINIDEEFYEDNMDKEWHQEYENTMNYLIESSFCQGRKVYQRDARIYPYETCAGEVDKYRLILTLNDIGKSFLVVDEFLNKGNCYFLS